MAVESLHGPTIFEKLGDNLENFSIGLTRVRDFFSACLKETRGTHQIIEDLERLTSALGETIALCKDYAGNPEPDCVVSLIFANFAHLFKSLSSVVGVNLSTSPTEIVSNLSLEEHFNHNSKSRQCLTHSPESLTASWMNISDLRYLSMNRKRRSGENYPRTNSATSRPDSPRFEAKSRTTD